MQSFLGAPGIIQCSRITVSREIQNGPPNYNMLLMEYAAGGSLSDLIADHRRRTGGRIGIPERIVRFFTLMLLRAIRSNHSCGITHCDIKPDNILVFPAEVKVATLSWRWIDGRHVNLS
ncbi:Mitogen-activated protein kinase kinase kinase 20 [Linum grandiflorum]